MHRASSKSVRERHQQPRGQPRYLISDSSSCGGYESAESEKDIVILASEQIQALEITQPHQNNSHENSSSSSPTSEKAPKVSKKKSFWQQLFTSKKSNKKCVS